MSRIRANMRDFVRSRAEGFRLPRCEIGWDLGVTFSLIGDDFSVSRVDSGLRVQIWAVVLVSYREQRRDDEDFQYFFIRLAEPTKTDGDQVKAPVFKHI